VRSDAGALLAQGLLGDLDDNFLPFLEQVSDAGCAAIAGRRGLGRWRLRCLRPTAIAEIAATAAAHAAGTAVQGAPALGPLPDAGLALRWRLGVGLDFGSWRNGRHPRLLAVGRGFKSEAGAPSVTARFWRLRWERFRWRGEHLRRRLGGDFLRGWLRCFLSRRRGPRRP